MASATEAQVREACAALLPGLDLEAVTERQVVHMVEARLGVLLGEKGSDLRNAVQGAIDAFLLAAPDDKAAAAASRNCLLYTSPSPRDGLLSRMPSSA